MCGIVSPHFYLFCISSPLHPCALPFILIHIIPCHSIRPLLLDFRLCVALIYHAVSAQLNPLRLILFSSSPTSSIQFPHRSLLPAWTVHHRSSFYSLISFYNICTYSDLCIIWFALRLPTLLPLLKNFFNFFLLSTSNINSYYSVRRTKTAPL